MRAFTLKNIPDRLHTCLKQSAKDNHRSLNSEILYRLQQAVGTHPVQPEETLEEARKLRKQVQFYLTDDKLNEYKNQGRKK